MKKFIFLLIAISAMIASCKKETPKNPYEQTLIVEVYFLDSNGVETIPTESVVWIFEDADFELGWLSHISMQETTQRMTLTNGTEVDHKFKNPQDWRLNIHRHVFENVPNGEYFITVLCIVRDMDGTYLRGYRRINVDKHIHEVVQKIVFTDDDIVVGTGRFFVEK
jgi:hypothetical protein